MLSAEVETFLARREEEERALPRFVARELRGFLDCGILAHGFLRVRCPVCREERLVPFSCKGRGLCPSCGGRRMADTAAWLVDRVLPEVPVRQWVLTLPFALRYRLAFDAELTAAVLREFLRAVFAALRRRAHRECGVPRGQCGAVVFVQKSRRWPRLPRRRPAGRNSSAPRPVGCCSGWAIASPRMICRRARRSACASPTSRCTRR